MSCFCPRSLSGDTMLSFSPPGASPVFIPPPTLAPSWGFLLPVTVSLSSRILLGWAVPFPIWTFSSCCENFSFNQVFFLSPLLSQLNSFLYSWGHLSSVLSLTNVISALNGIIILPSVMGILSNLLLLTVIKSFRLRYLSTHSQIDSSTTFHVPMLHFCDTHTTYAPCTKLQAFILHVQKMTHSHVTYYIYLKNLARNAHFPAKGSRYANGTHDTYLTPIEYIPQTMHPLHTLLTHHTHTHTPSVKALGFLQCQDPAQGKMLNSCHRGQPHLPSKLHKDFSKKHSLLLTSITCLINSQAWLEGLIWGSDSIQEKRNGEQKGLMCWVSKI